MGFLEDFNPRNRKLYFLNLEFGARIQLMGKDRHPIYHRIRINGWIAQVHRPAKLQDPIKYLVILENGDIVTAQPESIIKVLNDQQPQYVS